MITPEETTAKLERLYPKFLEAWLTDAKFFPKKIPFNRTLPETIPEARDLVQQLRKHSKECVGHGYSIEWEERNSKAFGRNLFPKNLVVESEADLLLAIGKQKEFRHFSNAVAKIREHFPELVGWIRSSKQLLISNAHAIDGLIEVVSYLQNNPRPNVFARELPLTVDTKFVENNRGILRQWLDLILPPCHILSEEQHFERRFGLKYLSPFVTVRILDPTIQDILGCSWPEFAIPLETLAKANWPPLRVMIVENKVNLQTLPEIPVTIALGGMGNGVTDLLEMPWLKLSELYYWGDMDLEGLQILSRVRAYAPHTRSLFMDSESVSRWQKSIGSKGNGIDAPVPSNLTPKEQEAFQICRMNNLRIEQERIPQGFVLETLRTMFLKK